jgi:hypothetical protein
MKITHYKSINKGSMMASFNVTIPKWADFEIRNCVLFEANAKRWVNLPSKEYEDKQTQKKKYFQLCGYADNEKNDKLKEAIMKAVDEHIKTLAKQEAPSKNDFIDQDDDLPF